MTCTFAEMYIYAVVRFLESWRLIAVALHTRAQRRKCPGFPVLFNANTVDVC